MRHLHRATLPLTLAAVFALVVGPLVLAPRGAHASNSCGDGFVGAGEGCDDDNTTGGDGCSSTCQVEEGWQCFGNDPSTCSTICGDDIVAGDEECDGSNLDDATCENLGYDGGTLACGDQCFFDTTDCTSCGNGIR